MRRFLSVSLAMIIVLLSCVGCSKTKINNMFDSFEVETTEPVAYVCYNILKFKERTLNFEELFEKMELMEYFVKYMSFKMIQFGLDIQMLRGTKTVQSNGI